MRTRTTKAYLLVIAAVGLSMVTLAVNQSYTGNGTDANDWFDTGNWSGGAYPVGAADNALFVNTGKNMTISQSTPAYGQMQVGRGVANAVTIASGGVVTNLNQTVVGIAAGSNTGAGTLVIDGGTLRIVHLRSSVSPGVQPNNVVRMQSGLLDINKTATLTKGDMDIGELSYAHFILSGGTVTVENNINIDRGIFNVIGDGGSVTVGNAFNFGTAELTSVRMRYELTANRGTSTINADSFSYLAGSTRELIIDGGNADPGAFSVTLMSLATDTFSGAELTAMQGILQTSNIDSGTLSLANGDQDLVFTGTVIPEPATLSLIAVMGGGILFVRRLMM